MTEKPSQLLPPLAADEYAALKADIAERGVQVPVEYDEHGNVLDGHHRIQICVELGIAQWPQLVRHGLSEVEKRSHARRLNLHRRHLDQAQRRTLITDELRDAPAASDRAVAAGLGVDHKTVATVRAGLEATGEIPQLDARKDVMVASAALFNSCHLLQARKKGCLCRRAILMSAVERPTEKALGALPVRFPTRPHSTPGDASFPCSTPTLRGGGKPVSEIGPTRTITRR